MPRSSTIWAAALVLASLSGSGPMLTTAEAMPAPGPQQTALRPRYYFPRHVKRMIVTNSTAPAAATSSSSSSSSGSDTQLDSRQSTARDLTSFFESLFGSSSSPSPADSSSSQTASSTAAAVGTGTTVADGSVTSVPASSIVGTGGQVPDPLTTSQYTPPPPIPVSSSAGLPSSNAQDSLPSSSVVGSTAGLPSSIVPATSAPGSATQGAEAASSALSSAAAQTSVAEIPSASSIGSTGGAPAVIVQPTSSAIVQSSAADNPPPSSAAGSTDGVPSSIVQPTAAPVVGSTGGVPESVVAPTAPASTVQGPSPTAGSSILGPFIVPSQGSTGGFPETTLQPTSLQAPVTDSSNGFATATGLVPLLSQNPVASTGGVLPSESLSILPTGSGGLIGSILTPTAGVTPTDTPLLSSPTSTGIVVGITTAFGTETATPTASLPIPVSESKSGGIPLLSSLISELTSILPSETLFPTGTGSVQSSIGGITDPTPGPTAPTSAASVSTLPSESPSTISAVTSGSEVVSPSVLPTDTALPSSIPVESSALSTAIPTESSGILPPPASTGASSGLTLLPTGGTSGATSIPTSLPTSIPVSEEPPSTTPSVAQSTGSLATPTVLPPSSTNITEGATGVPTASTIVPGPTAATTSGSVVSSSTIPVSEVTPQLTFSLPTTTKPKTTSVPPASILPTATDSETTYLVGTSIIQEPTTIASPSPTSSGIPSELPKMIAPPGGFKTAPADSFYGQVGFKWQLNYPFVSANDGGNQIFTFLPMAIADALNISMDKVVMSGLKPFDTLQYSGFITTLALFYIPADTPSTLAAQLRNPLDPFWHNKNETVNQLTNLINTAFPLPAGKLPGEGDYTQTKNPQATTTGGASGGGAMGGDMSASRKVNPTSAGIATGAVMGAIAYGAAMFFVARRYRNKKMRHQRSSSVPSSRYTYGSIQGDGTFMSGGRAPGRYSPGGRDSLRSGGTGSSNGRSVRTQQISAPVMAENSLGWN